MRKDRENETRPGGVPERVMSAGGWGQNRTVDRAVMSRLLCR